MIAILVIARGISDSVINRFIHTIEESKPDSKYDIVTETASGDDSLFNKAKWLNKNLRNLIPKYTHIIQTDIDVCVPHGLIDETITQSNTYTNSMIHCMLRYAEISDVKDKKYSDYPWSSWRNQVPTFCSGCWNGAKSEIWKMSGGYNDKMVGWGVEDSEFVERSKKRGVRWRKIYNFPLIHINHPRRTKRMVEENKEIAEKYSDMKDWLEIK